MVINNKYLFKFWGLANLRSNSVSVIYQLCDVVLVIVSWSLVFLIHNVRVIISGHRDCYNNLNECVVSTFPRVCHSQQFSCCNDLDSPSHLLSTMFICGNKDKGIKE